MKKYEKAKNEVKAAVHTAKMAEIRTALEHFEELLQSEDFRVKEKSFFQEVNTETETLRRIEGVSRIIDFAESEI